MGKIKLYTMKIIELVNFFRNGGSFEDFCQNNSLDIESEVIEVYMEQPFKIENDLAFFEIEKTEGKTEYLSNDVKYINLFDFFYFMDMIEELQKGQNSHLTDEEVAVKLLNYAINDA